MGTIAEMATVARAYSTIRMAIGQALGPLETTDLNYKTAGMPGTWKHVHRLRDDWARSCTLL